MAANDKRERRAGYLLALFFLVLTAGIVLGGFYYYRGYERNFRIQVEHQLSAIADLKVNELVNWRKERLADANILLDNPSFSTLVRRLFENQEDVKTRQELYAWLQNIQTGHLYERAYLLDVHGVIRISAPDAPLPTILHLEQDTAAALQSGQVLFLDLHRDGPGGPPHMALLIPIYDDQDKTRPLGVVALRIDPHVYLYPMIKRWPTPSETAETLIVRRDGNDALFLNELRFQKNTELILRIPLDKTNVPAVAAVLGHEGIMEGVDYRSVPVVAMTRSVPDSPWFVVARMDRAEVYAPIRQRLWLVTVLGSVLLFGAMAGMGMIWRQQRARFYQEQYESAEALRESEARFRATFEQAAVGIAQLSLDGHWMRVNDKLCNIVGYPREELLTLTFQDITHPDDLNADLAYVAQVLAGEIKTYSIEKRYIRKDHTTVWINLTVGLVRDDAGTPNYFISVVEDITERKQAGIILLTRLRLAKLYDQATLDELIQAGLDAAELLTGSTIGFFHYVAADQEHLTLQTWSTNTLKNRCTAEGKGQHCPINQAGVWVDCIRDRVPVIHNDYAGLPHKKGLPPGHAPVTRELVVPILRNDAIVAIMGVGNKPADYTEDDVRLVQELLMYIVDTVERKRAESTIRETERLLHESQRVAGLGAFVLNIPDGIFVTSDLMDELHGIDEAYEHSIAGWSPLIHPDDRAMMMDFLLNEVIEREQPCDREYRIVRFNDNVTRWMHTLGTLEKDANGRPIRLHGTSQDITARKIAAETLRASEIRYRRLFESSKDGILILDADTGAVVDINPFLIELLGFSREDTLGKKIWDMGFLKDVIASEDHFLELQQQKYIRYEDMALETANGQRIDVEFISNVYLVGQTKVIQCNIRDITERKQAEQALKRIEWMLSPKTVSAVADVHDSDNDQGYGDLTELNHSGIILQSVGKDILLSITGDYLDLMGTSSAIYEKNGDYACGIFSSSWCRMMDRASRNLCAPGDNVAALNSGKWLCHESCWKCCSREAMATQAPVDIECSGGIKLYGVPIFANNEVIGAINFGHGDPPKDPAKLRELADAYCVDYEDLVREANAYDSRPTYIIEMAKNRLQASARLIGMLVERKQAEEQIRGVMADLERSNKELEQFAYVASHDLQEPLRMVSSYTQLLAERYEGQMDEKAMKYIQYAVDGAVRMQHLINDLLAFSRVGTQGAAFALIDSHAALGLAVVNLQGAIQESSATITNDDLPMVYADASQLAHVFQNLIGNAIKFRGTETPHVHISAKLQGNIAEFTVRDNGIGIDPKYADRIFQLFQRLHTRAEYPGTGIGLALCKRIVERHRGKIWFDSEPDKGAYFHFTVSTSE